MKTIQTTTRPLDMDRDHDKRFTHMIKYYFGPGRIDTYVGKFQSDAEVFTLTAQSFMPSLILKADTSGADMGYFPIAARGADGLTRGIDELRNRGIINRFDSFGNTKPAQQIIEVVR